MEMSPQLNDVPATESDQLMMPGTPAGAPEGPPSNSMLMENAEFTLDDLSGLFPGAIAPPDPGETDEPGLAHTRVVSVAHTEDSILRRGQLALRILPRAQGRFIGDPLSPPAGGPLPQQRCLHVLSVSHTGQFVPLLAAGCRVPRG